MNKTVEKRAYTVEEVMEMLDIGKNTAYNLIKSGEFKCVKIGCHYRVSKNSFDEWLVKKEREISLQECE